MKSSSPWVSLKNDQRARCRLFCFPFAGGGASAFRLWTRESTEGIEVCPVQLPGRENRFGEPAICRLDALVEAMLEPLLPLLDRPFAFFGHSFGGLVAWELARALERRGHTGLVRLFVSASVAPKYVEGRPPIHRLADAEFLEALRGLNGFPAEVFEHPELLRLTMPVMRADMEAYDTFVDTSRRPVRVPISVFMGTDDATVAREHAAAWGEQTRAGFSLRLFEGDHFFIHSQRTKVLRAIVHDLTDPTR